MKSAKIKKFVITLFVLIVTASIFTFIYFNYTPDRPNILLITVDALRPDHLGCYGYERNTSPNIDKLAKEGTVFLNCFATSSSTAYASVGLVTGKYLMIYGNDEAGGILDKKFPTITEYLKESEYFTAAFLNNGHYASSTGFERGFDFYKNFIGNAKQTTDEVISFLNNYNADKPLFIWIHYIDPHTPYVVHKDFLKIFEGDSLWNINDKNLELQPNEDIDPYLSKGFIPRIAFHREKYNLNYYIACYDSEISYLDFHIGRLMDNMPNSALTILTADHGEFLGEHNEYFSHGG